MPREPRNGELRQVQIKPAVTAVHRRHDRDNPHHASLIGHSDDRDFDDRRMLGQQTGHTMWVRPQAARLEAVTHATDESVGPVIATLHQVTGVQPTTRAGPGRRHRFTKVARHDRVATHEQLADPTRRHRVVLGVANPHVEPWDHMTHGPANHTAGTVGQ